MARKNKPQAIPQLTSTFTKGTPDQLIFRLVISKPAIFADFAGRFFTLPPYFEAVWPFIAPLGGTANGFLPSDHPFSPCQAQIGQANQREHLRRILPDSLVARLRVSCHIPPD
jgi:hypothetical protein